MTPTKAQPLSFVGTQTKAYDSGQEKMSFLNNTKSAIVADKLHQKVHFRPFCLEKTNGMGFVQ